MAIDESPRVDLDAPAKGASPSPESTPEPNNDVTVLDLFRRIYQFFYSKTVGLVIILVMAVLVLLGAVIGQAPAGTYSDPAAKEQFLATAGDKYGRLTEVMDFLGLFHIFSAPIFLAVTGLLALSIIACTTHRIPQLWQRYRHPRTHVSDRFFDRARYSDSAPTSIAGDEAMTVIRECLRARHYRVLSDNKDPDRSVYADRFAWGGFGTVIAHASFIIILAAFALSASTGTEQTLTIPVGGSPVNVGNGTTLALEATTFNASYNDDGRPLDYVSHLILHDGDDVVAEQEVRVNEPLRYDGMKFHQATFGIAADVLIADADGKTIADESVPLKWTSNNGAYQIGALELPDQNIEIQVILPASGRTDSTLAAGEAAFEIHRLGESEAMGTVTAQQGTPIALGDMSATFQREREYTGIMVRQDPGAVWMWIGSALLVIGMMITFTCRHRRVWIRVDETDGTVVRFASADKEDLSFERQFDQLVGDIAVGLADHGTDTDHSTDKERAS